MADDVAGEGAAAANAMLGAAPGLEHLSSLHDAYLRLLAPELGLGYLRLQSPDDLAAALTAGAPARPVPSEVDGRRSLALLAPCLLMARYLPRAVGLLRRLGAP